eukprot:m.78384 g.78384  ORF g.78384 m.78384 type:complete len:485 (+) comp10705_c0_seq1:165-1619(+)
MSAQDGSHGSTSRATARTATRTALNAVCSRLTSLRSEHAQCETQIEAVEAELARLHEAKAGVAERMAAAEAELEAVVQAPVPGGEDPTLWIPDEILFLILLTVVHVSPCVRVCRRWNALCRDPAIAKLRWMSRWDLYSMGQQLPKALNRLPNRILNPQIVLAIGGGATGVTTIAVAQGANAENDDDLIVDRTLPPAKILTVWRENQTGFAKMPVIEAKGSDALEVSAVVVCPRGGVYVAGARRQGRGEDCVQRWTMGGDGVYRMVQAFDGGHRSRIESIVVVEDRLYSGSFDRTVVCWDCSTGKVIGLLRGHIAAIRALAAVSVADVSGCSVATTGGDETVLCSGSDDTVICVWSLRTRTLLRPLLGHTGKVLALAAGDRGELVSGSTDRSIRVWSLQTGEQLLTLVAHTNAVNSLAVWKDGTIFSGSWDCSLRVIRDFHGEGDEMTVDRIDLQGRVPMGIALTDTGLLVSSLRGSHSSDLVVW